MNLISLKIYTSNLDFAMQKNPKSLQKNAIIILGLVEKIF